MTPLPPSFWWVFPACLAASIASLWRLAGRAGGGRGLRGIVLGSFGLRVLLGLLLFVVSDQRWPVFRSLQAPVRGFWLFGLDGALYHDYGILIVDAWRHGVPLPSPGIGFEYCAVVAAIYRWLGAHPLYPVLLNGWVASSAGLLAFLIARGMVPLRPALTAAALVSFWPSSLLWSSQLLKDPLVWCLALLLLYLLFRLAPDAPRRSGAAGRSGRWRAGRRLALWAALAVATIVCTQLRFYVGMALAGAVLAVLGPAAALAAVRRQAGRGLRYAGLLAVVVLCAMFARTLNTHRLLSPLRPDLGHVGRAVEYWQRGALEEAAYHFHRAMSWDPTDEEVYLSLAAVRLQQGNLAEAARVYEGHLGHEQFAKSRPVQAMLARLREARDAPDADEAAFQLPAIAAEAAALSSLAAGQPPAPATRLQMLAHSLSQLDDQAFRIAADATPKGLGRWRAGYLDAAGHSVIDADVRLSTLGQLAAYLPRALAIGLLAPFPWQWLDIGGSTSMMRWLSGVEMALVYLLLLGGLPCGLRELWTHRRGMGMVLVLFIVLAAASLSLVVANLGILFRVRLVFLLPLMVVAACGDPLMRYRQAWDRLAGSRVRPKPSGRAVPALAQAEDP